MCEGSASSRVVLVHSEYFLSLVESTCTCNVQQFCSRCILWAAFYQRL